MAVRPNIEGGQRAGVAAHAQVALRQHRLRGDRNRNRHHADQRGRPCRFRIEPRDARHRDGDLANGTEKIGGIVRPWRSRWTLWLRAAMSEIGRLGPGPRARRRREPRSPRASRWPAPYRIVPTGSRRDEAERAGPARCGPARRAAETAPPLECVRAARWRPRGRLHATPLPAATWPPREHAGHRRTDGAPLDFVLQHLNAGVNESWRLSFQMRDVGGEAPQLGVAVAIPRVLFLLQPPHGDLLALGIGAGLLGFWYSGRGPARRAHWREPLRLPHAMPGARRCEHAPARPHGCRRGVQLHEQIGWSHLARHRKFRFDHSPQDRRLDRVRCAVHFQSRRSGDFEEGDAGGGAPGHPSPSITAASRMPPSDLPGRSACNVRKVRVKAVAINPPAYKANSGRENDQKNTSGRANR